MADGEDIAISDVEAFEAGFVSAVDDVAEEIRAIVPGSAFMGMYPGQWSPDGDGMPPHCPVRALGYDGDSFYFLSARGTITVLDGQKANGKAVITSLFAGATQYLWWAWPAKSLQKARDPLTHEFILNPETGRQTYEWAYKKNFSHEDVLPVLYNACVRAGSWNMLDRVRGRGAWLGEDDALVLHLGDKLLINGEPAEPGVHGIHVYPRRPAIAAPGARESFAGEGSGAWQIHEVLQSWNWVRGDLAADLLLGWMAVSGLGGALDFRPTIFMTGDKATGKSKLQEFIHEVAGGGLLQTADTTGAGIYQTLQNDSLPVAVDELEAEADTRKAQAVVKLARLAATGGTMNRGGADHNSTQFTARSCFVFSSINMPPMSDADRSRMGILQLRPIEKEKRGDPPDLSEAHEWGRDLQRRMIDCWVSGHFQRCLDFWTRALIDVAGHDGRGAAAFGTLMAGAWTARYDSVPEVDAVKAVLEQLRRDTLTEYQSDAENWRRCLDQLLNAAPDALRDTSVKTVGGLLLSVQRTLLRRAHDNDFDVAKANKRLQPLGLKLTWAKDEKKTGWKTLRLFVAGRHPGVGRLFQDTDFAGAGGLNGVWSDALAQAPNDVCWGAQGRVVTNMRGTMVRLSKILGEGIDEDD